MVTVIVPPSCDRQTDALTDRQTDIHTTHMVVMFIQIISNY